MTLENSEQGESGIAPARQGRLAGMLAVLAPGEGMRQSEIPGVKLMRSSSDRIKAPTSYEPSIVIIAQGRKRGYLGKTVFTYDANHFLVLSVPLPFECETVASPEGPMLGLSIGVTSEMVAELMMGMETPLPIPPGKPEAVRANRLDAAMYDAAVRLVEALETSDDARILGPQIIREIVYRVLVREDGAHLRSLAAPHSHFGRISRSMHRMHQHFAQAADMTTLASEAGMSVSTFHSHFKAVARSSPLQYLKTIRLHKARMLMMREGETAAGAALRVGYESASQFSREFKRLFGAPPAAEVEKLKANLIQME